MAISHPVRHSEWGWAVGLEVVPGVVTAAFGYTVFAGVDVQAGVDVVGDVGTFGGVSSGFCPGGLVFGEVVDLPPFGGVVFEEAVVAEFFEGSGPVLFADAFGDDSVGLVLRRLDDEVQV